DLERSVRATTCRGCIRDAPRQRPRGSHSRHDGRALADLSRFQIQIESPVDHPGVEPVHWCDSSHGGAMTGVTVRRGWVIATSMVSVFLLSLGAAPAHAGSPTVRSQLL